MLEIVYFDIFSLRDRDPGLLLHTCRDDDNSSLKLTAIYFNATPFAADYKVLCDAMFSRIYTNDRNGILSLYPRKTNYQ